MQRGVDAPRWRGLIGRDSELEKLKTWLEQSWLGPGGAALVEGEPGIGKSALCEAVAKHATDRGGTTLIGRGDEVEQERPFGLVSGLLRGLKGVEEASRWATRWREPAGAESGTSVFTAADEFIDLLEVISSAPGVLLVIDDLQWADRPSVLVLNNVLKRTHGNAVAILLSFRSTEFDPDLARVIRSVSESGATQIRLGPLSEDDVAALLSESFGAAPGPALMRLAEGAAGNPFYLTQLIKVVQDEHLFIGDGDGVDLPSASLPPSLRLAILRRLSTFDIRGRELLRTAALIGSAFSISDLSAASDLGEHDVADALAPALSARVLVPVDRELGFAHDLVREALYEDVPAAIRRQRHRAVGRALAGRGHPPAKVVRHFVESAEVGDLEAISWITRAAEELSMWDPGTASDILGHAVHISDPASASHREMLLDQARWLMWAARFAEATSVARKLLGLDVAPDVQCQLRLFLIQSAIVAGDLETALDHAGAGLTLPPETKRFPHLLAEAALVHLFVARQQEAATLALRASELGDEKGDAMGAGLGRICLALLAMLRGDFTEAVHLTETTVELANRSAELSRHAAFLLAGRVFLETDDLRRAHELAHAAVQRHAATGTGWLLPMYYVLLGTVAFHEGRWDDALAEFSTSEALSEETGNWGSWPAALSLRAEIEIDRGELDLAESLIQEAEKIITAAPGFHWHAGDVMWARAQLLVARGNEDQALSLLTGLWDMRVTFGAPAGNRGIALLLLDLARKHDPERSTAYVEMLESLAQRSGCEAVRGMALFGRGIVDEDPLLIRESVEWMRRCPRVVERIELLEWAACASAQLEPNGYGRELAEEVASFYASVDAHRSLARGDARFRNSGIVRGRRGPRARPTVGWASLTPTEERVVRLVAQGMRNAEIADRLVISVRTVETHLSRVYAKVGLRSRVQLATEAARLFLDAAQ
jgi:DNA-binding CsgD family transcriptional regulator/tetratricopeptide (TPR) repeat protein